MYVLIEKQEILSLNYPQYPILPGVLRFSLFLLMSNLKMKRQTVQNLTRCHICGILSGAMLLARVYQWKSHVKV